VSRERKNKAEELERRVKAFDSHLGRVAAEARSVSRFVEETEGKPEAGMDGGYVDRAFRDAASALDGVRSDFRSRYGVRRAAGARRVAAWDSEASAVKAAEEEARS